MLGHSGRDFKDYCLILQVHPEADAQMIEAAYWHLAKRYNQAALYDAKARARLEDLNEAYTVLGNAARKDVYLRERARVLGEGALPIAVPPVAAAPKPPLSIMERHRPRPRTDAAGQARGQAGGRLQGLLAALTRPFVRSHPRTATSGAPRAPADLNAHRAAGSRPASPRGKRQQRPAGKRSGPPPERESA
jgi:curved DNA-binding protein CbpA